MAKASVVWTQTAIKQRREIFKYWTERNGSSSYAEKLLVLIKRRINVIRLHPESYKKTIYPDTRISAMGHFSILYKVVDSRIIVTAFWDNRQEPAKLLELISKP